MSTDELSNNKYPSLVKYFARYVPVTPSPVVASRISELKANLDFKSLPAKSAFVYLVEESELTRIESTTNFVVPEVLNLPLKLSARFA